MAPVRFANLNHGKTLEACSLLVSSISSPLSMLSIKKPFTIIFSDSVAPLVNTISSNLLALINSLTKLLVFSYSSLTL